MLPHDINDIYESMSHDEANLAQAKLQKLRKSTGIPKPRTAAAPAEASLMIYPQKGSKR